MEDSSNNPVPESEQVSEVDTIAAITTTDHESEEVRITEQEPVAEKSLDVIDSNPIVSDSEISSEGDVIVDHSPDEGVSVTTMESSSHETVITELESVTTVEAVDSKVEPSELMIDESRQSEKISASSTEQSKPLIARTKSHPDPKSVMEKVTAILLPLLHLNPLS